MDPELERYLDELQFAWERSGLDRTRAVQRRDEAAREVEGLARALLQRGITHEVMHRAIAMHRGSRFRGQLALPSFPGVLAPLLASNQEEMRGLLSQPPAAIPPEAVVGATYQATGKFIQGVVAGVVSVAHAIDAGALDREIRAAFDAEDYGFGVLIGVAWSAVEDLQESAIIADWVLRVVLLPEVREQVRQAAAAMSRVVIALLETLHLETLGHVAYRAGYSIGVSRTRAIEAALLAPVPSWLPGVLHELWPAIRLGRLLGPIILMMISVAVPALRVGAVATASRLSRQVFALALVAARRLPDSRALRRVSEALTALRRPLRAAAPNIPAPARANVPNRRESATGVGPVARGLQAPATMRLRSQPATDNRPDVDRALGDPARGRSSSQSRANPESPPAVENVATPATTPRRDAHPIDDLHGSQGGPRRRPRGDTAEVDAQIRTFERRVEAARGGGGETAAGLARAFWNAFDKLHPRGDMSPALRGLFWRMLSSDVRIRGPADAEFARIASLLRDPGVRSIRVLLPRQGEGNRTPDFLAYWRDRRPTASRRFARSRIERIEVTTFADTIRPGRLSQRIIDKAGQLASELPGATPEGTITVYPYLTPPDFESVVDSEIAAVRAFLRDDPRGPAVRLIEIVTRDGRRLAYPRGTPRRFFQRVR